MEKIKKISLEELKKYQGERVDLFKRSENMMAMGRLIFESEDPYLDSIRKIKILPGDKIIIDKAREKFIYSGGEG